MRIFICQCMCSSSPIKCNNFRYVVIVVFCYCCKTLGLASWSLTVPEFFCNIRFSFVKKTDSLQYESCCTFQVLYQNCPSPPIYLCSQTGSYFSVALLDVLYQLFDFFCLLLVACCVLFAAIATVDSCNKGIFCHIAACCQPFSHSARQSASQPARESVGACSVEWRALLTGGKCQVGHKATERSDCMGNFWAPSELSGGETGRDCCFVKKDTTHIKKKKSRQEYRTLQSTWLCLYM